MCGYTVDRVLDDAGVVEILRSSKKKAEALPRALIPREHYQTQLQRQALRELARDVLGRGLEGGESWDAARSLLRRERPTSTAIASGEPLQTGQHDLARTTEIALGLDGSHLFVQGPPGSGKT